MSKNNASAGLQARFEAPSAAPEVDEALEARMLPLGPEWPDDLHR